MLFLMRGTASDNVLLMPCAVPRNISLGDSLLRNSFCIRSTSPRFSCVILISITSDYCRGASAVWVAASPRSYSFSFSSILRYKSTGWGVRRFRSSYHCRDTPASRHNFEMDTLAAFARRRMSFAKSLSLFFIIQKNYKYIDFNAFLHLPSLSARRCNSAMFCSTYSCTFAGHLPLSYMASRYSAGTFAITSPL